MLWPAPPPVGRLCACWSLRLLESKVVEFGIVEAASDPTTQRVLKNALQPHRRKYWVIPPGASGAFVAAIARTCCRPTRGRATRPAQVVCLDETSKQLVAETHAPVAMQPGLPARVDYANTRETAWPTCS